MQSGSSAADDVAPGDLVEAIQGYLSRYPAAAVLEDGSMLFDMRLARFSVSESHGRCLLQFWSEERNLMRTVTGVQERSTCLRIATRRMGNPKPQMLELVPTNDRRTPTARNSARRIYQKQLERILAREFLGAKVDGMRSSMDLEHSFGPAYARGWLLRGTAADAVIGVSSSEPAVTIDGILTLGILWLNYCREHTDTRRHVGGLKVIVPAGCARTVTERMAWLNQASAKFELFTLDEHSEEFTAVDFRDVGNIESRLVQAFSQQAAIDRCRSGLDRIVATVPEEARERIELLARSANEVSALLHGLEFARVRSGRSAHSFSRGDEITFGAGANETALTEETEPLCRDLLVRLCASRRPEGKHADPLFRLQPERWLESRLRLNMRDLLPGLRSEFVYSQVPALSSSDRGMLDLLTLDRDGRLAILELKADEDLHLPLQALDYWIRVHALNTDRSAGLNGRPLSAFERAGYFPGTEVSPRPPRLVLAAPALRIHPANEPVLRFLSPQIEWELIGLGEFWRQDLTIAFRKRSASV